MRSRSATAVRRRPLSLSITSACVAESCAGRDMAAKLQQIRPRSSTEAQALAPEQQSLEQERQRLAPPTRNLTAEQIRNNSALARNSSSSRSARSNSKRAATLAAAISSARKRSRCATSTAWSRRSCAERDDSARRRRRARRRQRPCSSRPSIDITTTVIQQLDQNPATRVANVARHPVAECQPQQPAAPRLQQ